MPRKSPTPKARYLHRVLIAMIDLAEAEQFIRAAQEMEAKGANPDTDAVHKALVCAAVIYYARPFSGNEHPNPIRRPRAAADSRVDVEPLHKAIPDAARRRLHRQIVLHRNKIVAHAESRYFEVKMVRSATDWTTADPSAFADDFSFQARRPFPRLDLEAMRLNALALRNVLTWQYHAIAPDVRRGKRLRKSG